MFSGSFLQQFRQQLSFARYAARDRKSVPSRGEQVEDIVDEWNPLTGRVRLDELERRSSVLIKCCDLTIDDGAFDPQQSERVNQDWVIFVAEGRRVRSRVSECRDCRFAAKARGQDPLARFAARGKRFRGDVRFAA